MAHKSSALFLQMEETLDLTKGITFQFGHFCIKMANKVVYSCITFVILLCKFNTYTTLLRVQHCHHSCKLNNSPEDDESQTEKVVY